MRRRFDEAAARSAERRKREDDAPRLLASVPTLTSLRLEIEERRPGISNGEASHIRRVVVEHAPALFVVPCHDKQCNDGGHDMTPFVMKALQAREERFEGEDVCYGTVGSSACRRVLRIVGIAEYRSG
jgi:hypothetical protein